MDGSFRSLTPLPTLASTKRHIGKGLPRWAPVRLSAGYHTDLFLSVIRPRRALRQFLLTSIVQDPLVPPPVSCNCGAAYSRFGHIRPGKRTPERYAAILVASCGVEPLSCGSKPPALPLSYLAVYVRFPLKLSHPGLGGDIMISHSQGSFQRDSAGAGHSCRRFFARHYDCRLCRMEGAPLRP